LGVYLFFVGSLLPFVVTRDKWSSNTHIDVKTGLA
jgi:hypothetical protein